MTPIYAATNLENDHERPNGDIRFVYPAKVREDNVHFRKIPDTNGGLMNDTGNLAMRQIQSCVGSL